MILYSIIPPEVVFRNFDYGPGNSDINSGRKSFITDYLNEKVEVMTLSNNQFVITRLISTSPKSYLNPKLQPGSIITGLNLP